MATIHTTFRLPNYREIRELRVKAKKSILHALISLVLFFFGFLYWGKFSALTYLTPFLPIFFIWAIGRMGYYLGQVKAKRDVLQDYAPPP